MTFLHRTPAACVRVCVTVLSPSASPGSPILAASKPHPCNFGEIPSRPRQSCNETHAKMLKTRKNETVALDASISDSGGLGDISELVLASGFLISKMEE